MTKETNLYFSNDNVDGLNKSSIVKGYHGGRIARSKASTTYKDVAPNISVREDYSFQDYESFRPSNTISRDYGSIMCMGNKAYYRVGIVRNVIDLMSDFGSKGARPVHKSVRANKIYNDWWKQIRGKQISERFLNSLYRLGNNIIKRGSAELNKELLDNWKQKSKKIVGASKKTEIPWSYTFINPSTLEIIGDQSVAIYSGDIKLGIKVDSTTLEALKKANIINSNILLTGRSQSVIPLDMNKIIRYYYKKDDWQPWAYPMTYAIMDNLLMVEKLRLADFAALDGAISHIRIWKLGNLEAKIFPKDGAIDKLADILMNNTGGGPIDIIWGPDLVLSETSTEVYRFLGMEKYVPHINAIYEGLGVPPTLTGSQTGSGFSNNFISLKTIIERLSYGREMLQDFWLNEFILFQQAIGLKEPAQLIFDRMNLSDNSSESAVAIQMYDRGLLSDEAMQILANELPDIERMRIKRESNMRKSGKMLRKAGPWNNPEHKEALEKIALGKGFTTKDILDELEATSLKVVSMPKSTQNITNDNSGIPQQGRPQNSKDKVQRKQKGISPRTTAFLDILTWAKAAQDKIGDIVNPVYLNMLGKNNLRKLTDEEFKNLEELKFGILMTSKKYTNIDEIYIKNSLNNEIKIDFNINELYNKTIANFIEKNNNQPTIEQYRNLQTIVYSFYNLEDYNGQI